MLNLEVKAIIKSPFVTLDCGRIDFDIVEVGKTMTKQVTVINRNPVESLWSAQTIPEISIEPNRLELPPLSEATVMVTWSPKKVYDIDNQTITMVGTEYGELRLKGASIRPHAEFSVACVEIPDLFVGVKSSVTLKLENRGPLEANFTILDAEKLPHVPATLQYKVTESTDLSPLGAYESRLIEVEIISFEKQEIQNFILAADVQNAERPALIEIKGIVRKLEVEVVNLADEKPCNSLYFAISSLYEVKSQRIRLTNKTGIKSKFSIRANRLQGERPNVEYEENGLSWKPELNKKQLLHRRCCFQQATDISRREFVKQMNAKSKFGMSIITDISEALLEPFAEQEITIIVSGLSWGTYKDQLIIEIDEMDTISINVEVDSSVAPLTTPTQFVRLGSVGAEHQVVKKVPISNLAPHPLQINLYLLDTFEKSLLAEYGELPLPLDDELEPTENSPFNCGEFVQAIAFNNRKMPFKAGLETSFRRDFN